MFISKWKAPATPVSEMSWKGGVLGEGVWPLEEMALRGSKLEGWEGVRSLMPQVWFVSWTDAVFCFVVFPCLCSFLASNLFHFNLLPLNFTLCFIQHCARCGSSLWKRIQGTGIIQIIPNCSRRLTDWKLLTENTAKHRKIIFRPEDHLVSYLNTHHCNCFFSDGKRRCRIIRTLASLVCRCCPHNKY